MSHPGTSATRWQTQTASGATPIIERERALALIAERLAEARSHAGSICLVSGEAGIGKTSLIRHAASLDSDACRWVWGSCDPLSTPRALGPLHDAARQTGGVLAERLFVGHRSARSHCWESVLRDRDARG